MKLIAYRGLIALLLTLLLALWMEPELYPQFGMLFRALVAAYALLLALQAGLVAYGRLSATAVLLFGFVGDIVAAGILVYATGGIESPFSFLLGLIVLASGTVSLVMLPLLTSVIACAVYLAAVYGAAAYLSTPLDGAAALHALLQVSAILLVGGVMAFIVRRHVGLRMQSDRVIRQHRHLKDLHGLVMASMNEGIVILDRQLACYEMNEAGRRLLGGIGDEQAAAVLFGHVPELPGWLQDDDGEVFHAEFTYRDRNILLNAKALQTAAHEPAWLITLVDITELRRLEARLIEQEKMVALGQMSAMLAHEIRNPIQTMAQGLELMRADPKKDAAIQDILHDEMLRLNRLVNVMLAYSRPLTPAPRRIDARQLLAAAVRQADLELKRVRWHCVPDALEVDPDHFRLVLDNLLSNALQHGDAGPVGVELEEDGGGWMLRVANRGTMPEEVRTRLFEPFVSGSARGIGLGLSTVHQVCKANGWRIAVEVDGEGVRFIVSAPGVEGEGDG